jgi:hypothetical protein
LRAEAVAIAKPSLFNSAVQKQVYCFGFGDRTSKPLLLGANAVTQSAIALAQFRLVFRLQWAMHFSHGCDTYDNCQKKCLIIQFDIFICALKADWIAHLLLKDRMIPSAYN